MTTTRSDHSGISDSLSIVIPAYNEADRIGPGLQAIDEYFASRPGCDVELLVVDDGSSDQTAARSESILRKSGLSYRVLTGRPNRGKGFSVREGALAATREWTLITDADLSTPIRDVERLLTAARRDGHDLVMGSRAMAGSDVRVPQGWLRQSMGRFFNVLMRGITGLPMRDTQCGFKLWNTRALRPVFEKLQVDGFAWDVELLMLAGRAGLSLGEVPVEWHNAEGSRVSMIGDSLAMFFDLLKIRWRLR